MIHHCIPEQKVFSQAAVVSLLAPTENRPTFIDDQLDIDNGTVATEGWGDHGSCSFSNSCLSDGAGMILCTIRGLGTSRRVLRVNILQSNRTVNQEMK